MNLAVYLDATTTALEKANAANSELRANLRQLTAILELLAKGDLDTNLAANIALRQALYEAQQSLRIDASSTALAIINDALAGKS